MANLPKQHRSVYEKSFNIKHVLKNLQGYKLATGEVAPSQLRQAREIYGDDEGKVYAAFISQEVGTSSKVKSGGARTESQRSRRKRKRQGHRKVGVKVPKSDSRIQYASTLTSSTNPESPASITSLPAKETSLHTTQSMEEYETPTKDLLGTQGHSYDCDMSSSLKLLASAYSDSSRESSEEDIDKVEDDSWFSIPDSIQQMFHEPKKTPTLIRAESASHSTNNDSDSDPHDLGYFKPLDSDDSDDSIQQHEIQQSKESPPSSLKEWDADKSKWVFSPSPLSSYVCWKCSKVGHLPKDCTVAVKEGGRKSGRKEGLRIPEELKSVYARCRELQKRKSDHCAECGVHSNLACCLECGAVYCDGRGHLSSHLLSHPSHHLIYSYKLARTLKCCKATCPVVNIYDLLVCSYCLSKAFSQHYSMINATWSQSGLRAIPNALCCEDHFDWHQTNCPSSGEEHFITVGDLCSSGLVKQLISEFFF